MILNEDLSFHDVRYAINSRISNDVELCFTTIPRKTLLPRGTALVRLDFPVVFGIFMKAWWMTPAVWQNIAENAGDTSALRMEWQHQLAMPKAAKGVRTQIIEIVITSPVYAWVGEASPLFHKKGGAEQVYLPNLSKGAGPDRSDYARRLRTYTLPAA